MTPRRLVVLLVAALLVIAAAIWISMQRELPREGALDGKVLPEVSGRINAVSEVHLVTAGDVTAVTIRKLDDRRWGVMQRDGYTADQKKLGQLLLALGELKVVEQKTSNPANYSRLGVEDVGNDKATGVRIDVLGLAQPASLIVGSAAGARTTYVRPAGAAASLLAQPQLSVERNPANWLDRKVLAVPADRVQEIRVSVAQAAPYAVAREKREQADFSVANLPEGRTLSSPAAASTIAGALADLNLDDVRAASAGEPVTGETSSAQYRLFDGTILTLTGTKSGDDHWIAVSVGFDDAQHERFAVKPAEQAVPAPENRQPGAQAPGEATAAAPQPASVPARTAEEVKKESEALARRVDGWRYKLPAYKFETLFQPIDDLLAPQ